MRALTASGDDTTERGEQSRPGSSQPEAVIARGGWVAFLGIALLGGCQCSDPNSPVVQDFEGRVSFAKWPKDAAGEVGTSREWRSDGEASLKIDPGLLAAMDRLLRTDFRGFDALQLHVHNPSDRLVTIGLELSDDHDTLYDRHRSAFGAAPGDSIVEIGLSAEMYRGEENRPYRGPTKTPLDLGKITRIAFENRGDKPVYLDGLTLIKDPLDVPKGAVALDFGARGTRVNDKMKGVFEDTVYPGTDGFGFTRGKPTFLRDATTYPTPMLGDGLAWGDSEFAIDLPGGHYYASVAYERSGFWETDDEATGYVRADLSVNGEPIHKHAFTPGGPHFLFQDTEITTMEAEPWAELGATASAMADFSFDAKPGKNTFTLAVDGLRGPPLRVAGLIFAPDTPEGHAYFLAMRERQRAAFAKAYPATDRSRRPAGAAPPAGFIVEQRPIGEVAHPRDLPDTTAAPHPRVLAVAGHKAYAQFEVYAPRALDLDIDLALTATTGDSPPPAGAALSATAQPGSPPPGAAISASTRPATPATARAAVSPSPAAAMSATARPADSGAGAPIIPPVADDDEAARRALNPRVWWGVYLPKRPYEGGAAWIEVSHYRPLGPRDKVQVAPDLARSVLVEFDVPPDAPPGRRSFVVDFQAGTEKLASVPVDVDIFTVTLPPLPIPVGLFMNALPFRPDVMSEEKWWRLQEALLRVQGEAGLNTPTGSPGLGYTLTKTADGYAFSGDAALRYLALAAKYGLDKAVVSYSGFLPSIKYQRPDAALFHKSWTAFEAEHRLPPHYLYSYDEPSTDEELSAVAAYLGPFREAGARTIGFFARPDGDRYRPVLDATFSPAVSGHTVDQLRAWVSAGKRVFLYNRGVTRLSMGADLVSQIHLGAAGRLEWIGLYSQGFAFDDLDAREPSYGMFLVHERLGLLPTPRWFSLREGLLDARACLALEATKTPLSEFSPDWPTDYPADPARHPDRALESARAEALRRLSTAPR